MRLVMAVVVYLDGVALGIQYCGKNVCSPEYGKCTNTRNDNKCGPNYYGYAECTDNKCCSNSGTCGTGDSHCSKDNW